MPYKGRMIFADKTTRVLCFEYMHNGSLGNFIYNESNRHNWRTRYVIIKEICEGLEYLHEKLEPPMYHLDLKPANVLLDENMSAKIADFGVSRLFLEEKSRKTNSALGTLGYTPPEYIKEHLISIKFDIFSLGVVIIKIMMGREGYFRSEEMSSQQFVELVHQDWMNRLQVISVHEYSVQVRRCIEIALSCVEVDRHKRPSIGLIVSALNKTESCVQISDELRNDSASSINQLGQLDGRLRVGMMVDPTSLVTQILAVVQLIRSKVLTASQNKEKCMQFVLRLESLGGILPGLAGANDAYTAFVLEGLRDAVGDAFTIIQSCRSTGTFSSIFSNRKAGDLDNVQQRIESYIPLVHVISYRMNRGAAAGAGDGKVPAHV